MIGRPFRTAVAVLAVGSVLALAACTTPDPVPTPTAGAAVNGGEPTQSPVPTPTEKTPEELAEEVKQANIEAAKVTLVEYYAMVNQVGQNKYEDWERLEAYWGSVEVIDVERQIHAENAASGMFTKGESRVVSLELIDYVADPTGAGHEQVSVRGCIDISGVASFNADGTPINRDESVPDRFYSDYTMQHLGQGQPWTISADDQYLDQSC